MQAQQQETEPRILTLWSGEKRGTAVRLSEKGAFVEAHLLWCQDEYDFRSLQPVINPGEVFTWLAGG